MTTGLHVVEIVSVLRMLTAELVFSDDIDDALGRLASTAAGLVAGPASCGVTVVGGSGGSTVASSCGASEALITMQYELGEGPCLTAIRNREMVLGQDLRHETRWPRWTVQALGSGVRGILAVPVDIDDEVIGALNLHAAEPDRFPPEVELTAMLLAEHAGLLMAGVLDRGRLASRAAELTAALSDGEVVNQAIGIVMGQRGCSTGTALGVLQRAATTLRIPLSAVAERLVNTIANRALTPRQQGR